MASSEADKPTKRTIKKSSAIPLPDRFKGKEESAFPPFLTLSAPFFSPAKPSSARAKAATEKHGEAPPSGDGMCHSGAWVFLLSVSDQILAIFRLSS
ncbi:hypothetical protein TNIN_365221 [Trichonephila inaurata madagascariensis]|uniref:Uncharacterized protein n=1 Tax=Trichonephila inaurata madagascariensis TaxID=2747483 RepID=A0A8X7BSZ2_9ARAC|nr:hypothetical protein TNIN_365221 [Trichonephila inaurata madagascariensis]